MPNILDDTIEKSFKNLNFDIIHVHHPMLIGKVALRLGKKYNIPVTFTYHTRYEFYLHNVKIFNILEEQCKNQHNTCLSELEGRLISYTRENFVPNYVRKFTNKCDRIFAPTKLIKDYLENIGSKAEIQVMPTGIDESYFIENKEKSDEIRARYKNNKEFLFSSKSETQGIVLLEAMAAKNPVIAVEATGVADVVENGINGYMIEENISKWVDRIIQLMNNSDEIKKLKLGAFNTALKYLNCNIAKISEENYKDVINRHCGTSYKLEEEQKYIASTR